MPSVNEQDLKKQIRSGNFSNLYLLYGEEKYLVKHYTNLLIKKIIPQDFKDFNLHIYDGKSFDYDVISEAAEAVPMFSDYSVIYINDLPLENISAESLDKLKLLFSDIPETTVYIVSLSTLDLSKNAKNKKVIGLFEKQGTAVCFSHNSLQQLAKLVEKGAQDRNCVFDFSEAMYLFSLVGDDMSVILNELEKICSYKKEGKITKSDIDSVVVKNMQARVFDLTKALMNSDCDTAMNILDTLFYMKEEPVKILAAIIVQYVDMYRAKIYSGGGMRPQDAAKDFNYYNKEFRLQNAARPASKYSVKQLRIFLDVLNEADTLLKSTANDGRLILEQTITKLLLVSNGEKI